MGSSLLITLREGLEIALVLAIIVAYLHKTGRSERLGTIWAGSAVAAVLCIATGFLFHQVVGEFEGKWEQFIEGTLAFAAVGVLTWMIFWMRGHARGITSDLHAKIDAAVDRSDLALAFVAFVAVAREGFETVLFLLGAETSSASGSAVVIGGLLGLAIASVLGYLFYLGADRVDLRKFLNWTGLLLIPFAAGTWFARATDLTPLDFSVSRAAMPLTGRDPFGADLLELFEEWRSAGAPIHGLGPHTDPKL